MGAKHYLIITNSYFDGSSFKTLEQVEKMGRPFICSRSTYDFESTQSGMYLSDIEVVKEYLLYDFLNDQFNRQDLRLIRNWSDVSKFECEIVHSTLNEVLCKPSSWDEVMEFWTYYWEEGRFEIQKKIRDMKMAQWPEWDPNLVQEGKYKNESPNC